MSRRKLVDLVGAALARVGSDPAASVISLQAAEHTYETRGMPGVYPAPTGRQLDIVGANGRRLIIRWDVDGVYVGGCLIDNREAAEALASFITREDES